MLMRAWSCMNKKLFSLPEDDESNINDMIMTFDQMAMQLSCELSTRTF